MAKKAPWYITFDNQNLVGAAIVIILLTLVVLFVGIPDFIQSKKLNQYNGQAIGMVTEVVDNTTMRQRRNGNRVYTVTYTVHYLYHVKEIEYHGSSTVKATSNSKFALNKITSTTSKQVEVRFDISNPSKSTIILD
ncbi:unnamed protein product [Ectocarpus fasciculatus]